MGGEKRGFSGKVMSLTTLLNPKTHDRYYSTHHLSGTVCIENAVKAIAADYHGAAVHAWTGDDAEFVALERDRRQLPDDTTLVSDNLRLGAAVVGGHKSAVARPERDISVGG